MKIKNHLYLNYIEKVKKTLDLNLSAAQAHGRGDGLSTPSLCDTPVSSVTNPNISDAR